MALAAATAASMICGLWEGGLGLLDGSLRPQMACGAGKAVGHGSEGRRQAVADVVSSLMSSALFRSR